MKLIQGVGYEISETEYQNIEKICKNGKISYLIKQKQKRSTILKNISKEVLIAELKKNLNISETCANLDVPINVLYKNCVIHFGTSSFIKAKILVHHDEPNTIG